MKLRFLGRESHAGNSPTVWDTDGDDYVIQGFAVTDRAALAQVGAVPSGELVIRVPRSLMNHLPKDLHGRGAETDG